ncbi:MAG: RNA polymerase sigma factor [Candidatus Aminicenantales bacterium]
MELEKVIQNCLEGDRGAWEMLVNAYSKKVFNMAYQFSGSYQEAEDLTQDIFVKLYGSLKKYDPGKNFTAWLLTLTKNHLIDEYRRTKLEKSQRDDFDDGVLAHQAFDNPEKSLAREESRKVVWEGLDRLSPEIRMAVLLRDIQGQTYDEIAESLELPLGTVKSRVNRGRLQLSRILQERKGEWT